MKVTFIAAAVLIATNLSVAQSNMVPGYIITAKGDTLHGFILDRNSSWSVSSINFATSAAGTPRVYDLSELSTMYLQSYDAYYQVRTVEIDKKPVDMAQLESDGARRIVTETLLLEQVVRGSIDLYDYTDEKSKRHFFVQKDGGKTEELPYVKYLTAAGRIVEMPFYTGSLQALTADCAKAGKPPRLDRKALIRYITEYNRCMGDAEVTKVGKKNRLIGTAFGGVSLGSGSYQGGDASNNGIRISQSNGSYGSSPAYNAGLFFEFHSSRASKRWRPGFQAFYQKTGTMKRFNTSSVAGEYLLSFSLVHFGPTIKYILTRQKQVTPYLKAGFSGVSVMSDDAIRTYDSQNPSKIYAAFKPFGYSGSLGAGIQWKIINVELRYQLAHAPAEVLSAAQYKGLDVVLGIQLYK
jgi:hypothetical protein